MNLRSHNFVAVKLMKRAEHACKNGQLSHKLCKQSTSFVSTWHKVHSFKFY